MWQDVLCLILLFFSIYVSPSQCNQPTEGSLHFRNNTVSLEFGHVKCTKYLGENVNCKEQMSIFGMICLGNLFACCLGRTIMNLRPAGVDFSYVPCPHPLIHLLLFLITANSASAFPTQFLIGCCFCTVYMRLSSRPRVITARELCKESLLLSRGWLKIVLALIYGIALINSPLDFGFLHSLLARLLAELQECSL